MRDNAALETAPAAVAGYRRVFYFDPVIRYAASPAMSFNRPKAIAMHQNVIAQPMTARAKAYDVRCLASQETTKEAIAQITGMSVASVYRILANAKAAA